MIYCEGRDCDEWALTICLAAFSHLKDMMSVLTLEVSTCFIEQYSCLAIRTGFLIGGFCNADFMVDDHFLRALRNFTVR